MIQKLKLKIIKKRNNSKSTLENKQKNAKI